MSTLMHIIRVASPANVGGITFCGKKMPRPGMDFAKETYCYQYIEDIFNYLLSYTRVCPSCLTKESKLFLAGSYLILTAQGLDISFIEDAEDDFYNR